MHPTPTPHTPPISEDSPSSAAERRPHWHSSQLLGQAREVAIVHEGQVYRLRLTALGKLILTK